MNQLRLWLESHLPSFFRPAETTVHVDIAGVELTLRDWEGSNVLAIVPKEILDDDYKLQQIEFGPGDVVIGANIGIVGRLRRGRVRILNGARCLRRVDHLGIEIHHNQYLASQRHTPEGLLRDLSQAIPLDRIALRRRRCSTTSLSSDSHSLPAEAGSHAGGESWNRESFRQT